MKWFVYILITNILVYFCTNVTNNNNDVLLCPNQHRQNHQLELEAQSCVTDNTCVFDRCLSSLFCDTIHSPFTDNQTKVTYLARGPKMCSATCNLLGTFAAVHHILCTTQWNDDVFLCEASHAHMPTYCICTIRNLTFVYCCFCVSYEFYAVQCCTVFTA